VICNKTFSDNNFAEIKEDGQIRFLNLDDSNNLEIIDDLIYFSDFTFASLGWSFAFYRLKIYLFQLLPKCLVNCFKWKIAIDTSTISSLNEFYYTHSNDNTQKPIKTLFFMNDKGLVTKHQKIVYENFVSIV
jgi:hypothetical protein